MSKTELINTEWDRGKKYIELRTGINMAYVEGGNPEGENIVMLHGYSDSSRAYRKMMQDMGNKYHIYALDLRGHGATDKPKQFAYTVEQHVEDVTSFLDQMKIRTFYAIGHSMGSVVSLGLGFSIPDRVKGLFMMSSFARFHHSSDDMKAFNSQFAGYEKNPPDKEEWIPNYRAYYDKEFPDYIEEAIHKWPGHCWKAGWYGLESFDFTKFSNMIKAPVMMIWGGMDDLVTEEHRKELIDLLPNAEYKVYPENTHELNQEIPEEIINDIMNFFGNIK